MNKKRIYVTVFLVLWVAVMTIANGMNVNTMIALGLALPIVGWALYLVWVDSKRPYDQQWRYANRKKGGEG